MEEKFFYKEEIFFTNSNDRELGQNQEKIIELLRGNLAVGVVGGFFEEGYPVYFISHFALNNLGLSFEQFMERTGGRYLNAVYEEDRRIFEAGFAQEKPVREYRMINGSGEPVWVNEIRTMSEAQDGRKIWVCSLRLIDEDYRRQWLHQEAFSLMKDTYYRISFVDLGHNRIDTLKLEGAEALSKSLMREDYRKVLEHCAREYVEEEFREKFLSILAPENLRTLLDTSGEPIYFTYRGLMRDKSIWVRSEIVPMEGYSPENPIVMWYLKNMSEEKAREKNLSDALLMDNASLRRSLNEEEQYRQAIISEAICVFNVNVSRNVIEEDFYKISGERRISVLPLLGMRAPCSADTFFCRWAQEKISEEDRANYDKCMNTRYLSEAYERGETELVLEYETRIDDEAPVILRHTILMIRDSVSGDIVAMNNLKDITSQRRKERETRKALLDAYEAANWASSAKTDFLSRMSHDIRTPMNAIIGMTAIAGTHLHEPEKMAECLGKITSASRHLLSLINEVLDMSKIESGTLSLSEEEFNLSSLMDNLLNMVRPMAQEKRHKLEVCIHDLQHENVVGDSMRIQQAFMNIVSNAVKYTPPEGKIRIELTEKPSGQVKTGCYEFVFIDNGIGMSQEFLKHLFEPFERAEDVRTSKVQGTGLGMPVARNIIRMMGGDIQVESEQEKGTRFTVQILLKYQEEDAVSLAELIRFPVLVADDDEIACRSTCLMLNELGLHSEGVLSGEDAVACVNRAYDRQEHYFAVILDWKMPGMDGIETAREIRCRVGPEVPIIILSGYDWAQCEMEARAAGVDAFITKPLFKSRLATVLRGFLEEQHAQEAEPPEEELEKTLEKTLQHDFTGKRVLLVEDNELNREIAVEILEMVGLEVESAADGSIAVDMVARAEPGYYNLVLMDIQMPVMNGYEATCAIRTLERKDVRALPIVAMTANAFAEDIQAAKSSGMNEHMAKPIDLNRLMEVLNRWL
ncbi:MAG: response regulator [bacterium]|nr:response regulator [bacterium]MCM1376467.1 response regulator [Muribaculum sp.]